MFVIGRHQLQGLIITGKSRGAVILDAVYFRLGYLADQWMCVSRQSFVLVGWALRLETIKRLQVNNYYHGTSYDPVDLDDGGSLIFLSSFEARQGP